ncbi:tRNA-modifying protein ygfZ, partial [Vibrio parahaemolyticus V-223/04]
DRKQRCYADNTRALDPVRH